jgi:hypothetical protein
MQNRGQWIFREKITTTTADRPQLAKLIKAFAPGDVVITPAVVSEKWRSNVLTVQNPIISLRKVYYGT